MFHLKSLLVIIVCVCGGVECVPKCTQGSQKWVLLTSENLHVA